MFHDQDLFIELRKKVAERALQVELAFHLENSSNGNTRNGHNRKTVHTEHGSLSLAVPRDRLRTFRPRLVEPWCRCLEGFDDLVLSLFASGLSMRAIRDQIAARYGAEVSPELVSKITDELHPEIRKWQNRPLEEVCAVLYLDAIHARIREDAAACTKATYLAIGVDCSGRKYPAIARSWHAHWEEVVPFLSFTQPVRKLIYVVVRQVERKWKRPPADWYKARREFAILFEDRFQLLPR